MLLQLLLPPDDLQEATAAPCRSCIGGTSSSGSADSTNSSTRSTSSKAVTTVAAERGKGGGASRQWDETGSGGMRQEHQYRKRGC
jgi:hypothetical protein